MALIKKNSDKPAVTMPPAGSTLTGNAKAAAEADPTETNTAAAEAAQAEAKAAQAEPAVAATATASASTGTSLVQKSVSDLVAATSVAMMDVISECKDKYRVDYDTLDRVQANNGNFLDIGKAKQSIGDTMQMQLMSWQDTWQLSPGSDDKEALEYVRYSDDGVTTTKGENVQEFLNKVRTIYPKASFTHRCTLVGVLVGSSKDSRLQGELIQIDLAQTSKKEFDKYKIGTAFKIGKGLLSAEAALTMTMTAEVTSAKDKSWTLVKFAPTL